jgi:hypothetical protein
MGANTPILRRMVLVVLMLMTVSAALPLEGAAQKRGNADAAQACAGGGYASRVRIEDGSRFNNAGECIGYVATGGGLDQDGDSDGAPDSRDNCASLPNAVQADADGDGTGDLCDLTPNGDSDGDGVDNVPDQCEGFDDTADTDRDGTPNGCDLTPNGDSDGDGIDNLSDSTPNGDSDGDGIDNAIDNCVDTVNAGQEDADGDAFGDDCDTEDNRDTDNDTIQNHADNCPNVANATQVDTDNDGIGDVCDVAASRPVTPMFTTMCSSEKWEVMSAIYT